MTIKRCLQMHGRDSVATVMIDIKEGGTVNIFSDENISLGEVTALDDIPFGNKIALVDIQKGDKVIKYGSGIGESTLTLYQKDQRLKKILNLHCVE